MAMIIHIYASNVMSINFVWFLSNSKQNASKHTLCAVYKMIKGKLYGFDLFNEQKYQK